MTSQPFLLQLARDHQLRRDARVIHTRQPQRAKAGHPFVSGQHIHHGVLQSVAHVQRTGNVRWRNYNGENRGGRVLINLRSEIAAFFPTRIVILLGFFRIVSFGDIDHFRKGFSCLEAGYCPPVRSAYESRRCSIVNHAPQLFISGMTPARSYFERFRFARKTIHEDTRSETVFLRAPFRVTSWIVLIPAGRTKPK